jgi:hypothetical protein
VVRISKENLRMKLKGRHPSRRPRSREEQDVRRHVIQKELNSGGELGRKNKDGKFQ